MVTAPDEYQVGIMDKLIKIFKAYGFGKSLKNSQSVSLIKNDDNNSLRLRSDLALNLSNGAGSVQYEKEKGQSPDLVRNY